MNQSLEDVFFKLLRMGLWGKRRLDEFVVLSPEEWEVVWQYARIHTVEGILFDSFTFLNEHQLPSRVQLMKWAVRADQIEQLNNRMNRAIASQYELFDSLGVNALLLKGQGVAMYYRTPLHRISGDIDWWFEGDGYNVLLKFLQKENIKLHYPLDSVGYEWGGVHCDHHKRLFDVFSPFNLSFLKNLQKKYRSDQETVEVGGQTVSILAPELQMVQVNVHIFKHLLSSGIGLRQLCDAAVLYMAYLDRVDKDQIEMIYKRIGVLNWIHVLHGVLVEYLGLPLESLPFPYPNTNHVDWMMNEIWSSGNFGRNDKRYMEKAGRIAPTRSIKGVHRMRRNFGAYFRYAPQEVLFYSIERFKGGVGSMIRGV